MGAAGGGPSGLSSLARSAALASILHGATSQAPLVSLSSDALEGAHLR